METENTKNWKDDYLINESLHAFSQNTSAAYSRLKINHPDHKDFQVWKAESEYWNNYNSNIRNLILDTEEIAEKEVAKINIALKNVKGIEDSFSKNHRLSM